MDTGRDHDEEEKPGGALPSAAPPGNRIFGKFRLLANLGSGGMGEVFLALSRSSIGGVNKLVVIKRLRHFAEDEVRSEAREMFLNEARLATLLNHPNIVQTNDVGVEDGHLYLTMEYLEGQPLNAIVRAAKAQGTRLDDAIVVKIISEALAGLHYAHELRDYDGTPLGIVHRDLSPHNLFVTYEGVAKVVDFGIAKTAGSAKTEQGIIKGKFAYMAPEQASDERVDRRADIFVLGIVLWELLSGDRLVFRRNDVQTVQRLLNDAFSPPSSVRPDITPELDAIVMKALERDPAKRYQTAREMREALENYLLARSHPVRQEEIGPVISDMFSALRGEMRQRIQLCIASAHDDVGMDDLPALTGRSLDSATTPHGSRPSVEVTGQSGKGPLSGTLAATMRGPERTDAASTPDPPRSGRIAIVAGVLAAATVAAALYGVAGRHHPVPAGKEPAAAAAARARETSPAPAAETVATSPAEIAPTTASASPAEPAPQPTRSPQRRAPGLAPSPRAAAPPSAPAPAAAPPTPASAPTSTSHARVFNTAL